MAIDDSQPRSILSTILVSLLCGFAAGLIWIGRVRLGFYLVAIFAALLVMLVVLVPYWPPLPLRFSEVMSAAFVVISVCVTLYLRAKSKPDSRYSRLWVVISLGLLQIIAALLIRGFVYQPYSIASGSMAPTLLVGDYVMVSKSAFGFRAKEPARGEVVIFESPQASFVMRLIGLPGDTVQMRDGQVVLNGEELAQEPLGEFELSDRFGSEMVPLFREILPDGRSYKVLDLASDTYADNTKLFEVPDGHYFMLGDNRDNSMDSRSFGFVPHELLVGPAIRVFANSEGNLQRDRQDLTIQ